MSSPSGEEPAWWLNVHTSNTEALLRLNVEAHERETMVALRDELLSLIPAEGDDAGNEGDLP